MQPIVWIDSDYYPAAAERLSSYATLVRPPTRPGAPWYETLIDADAAVCSARYPFDAALFERAPRLRVVARLGVGYDNVDVPAATAAGVCVCYTPNASNDSVVELAFGFMLALSRRICVADAGMHNGRWPDRAELGQFELRGKTLGIIGLGRIGTRLAQVGRYGFEMRVLAYDPYLSDADFRARHAEPAASLDELLGRSDVVSVHCPANAETRHLIDARAISLMKPSAMLINTARGPVVDEAALAEALAAGRLFGAGLDVFEHEPLAADSPLRSLPNVVMAPHIGGMSPESVYNIGAKAAENVTCVLSGTPPPGFVNPDVWQVRRGTPR